MSFDTLKLLPDGESHILDLVFHGGNCLGVLLGKLSFRVGKLLKVSLEFREGSLLGCLLHVELAVLFLDLSDDLTELLVLGGVLTHVGVVHVVLLVEPLLGESSGLEHHLLEVLESVNISSVEVGDSAVLSQVVMDIREGILESSQDFLMAVSLHLPLKVVDSSESGSIDGGYGLVVVRSSEVVLEINEVLTLTIESDTVLLFSHLEGLALGEGID